MPNRNRPQTLSGIETQYTPVKVTVLFYRNRPQTLSGIETYLAKKSGYILLVIEIDPKPFQGLKLLPQVKRPLFLPSKSTPNPFRD